MLIFDFDGVMINSIDEVTLTAFNTVTDCLHASLDALPAHLADLFKRNRFHVQPAGDQPLLMKWCLEHYRTCRDKILTPAEYQTILNEADVPLRDRTTLFYHKRRQLIIADEAAWLLIHQPYQPLWSALVKKGGHRIVILTNKDKDPLRRLCLHHHLDLPAENIYSGDDGATKVNNFKQIHARFGCKNYNYIDDSLKNLQELERTFDKELGRFSPMLAAWGYIGPDSIAQASALGYRVCGQQDIIRHLKY